MTSGGDAVQRFQGGFVVLPQLGILQTLQDAPFLRFIQRGRERLVLLFQFFVFGSGAAKTVGVLPAEGVRFIDVRPSARGLCRLAQARLDAGLVEDTAYFEPAYLKDFVVTAGRKKLF